MAASSVDISSAGEPSAPSSSASTHEMFCLRAKTMESCRRSRSGMTSEPLTAGHGEAVLTWCLGASRARTSAQLARAPASRASEAGSGGTCLGSFVRYDLDSCSWKTAQCSLLEGLDEYSETWPRSGTMRSGVCWEQTTVAPLTAASGFGSWPTPTKHIASEYGAPSQIAARDALNLGDLILAQHRGKLAPTPHGHSPKSARRHSFPTPTAGDAKSSGAAGYSTASGRHTGTTLTDAIVRFPTPTANDWKGPNNSGSGTASSNGLATRAGGQLNPTWVEWLMGWPLGWTDCEPLETARFREWQQQHSSCSEREGDGEVSRDRDRHKPRNDGDADQDSPGQLERATVP